MATFAPYRPGWQFKDGKLLQFGKRSVTVLRGGEAPMAWRRRQGGPWRHVRPKLDLTEIIWTASGGPLRYVQEKHQDEMRLRGTTQLQLPFVAEEHERVLIGMRTRQQAAQSFLDTLPPEVVTAVRRFDKRQWHMLALIMRCPGADELVASCPALAYMLASNWIFHEPAVKRPLRAARRLLRLPRPKALAWLGFPASRSAAKRLAKVPVEQVSIGMLLDLRRALHEPPARALLAHLPTIRNDIVRLVRTPEVRPYISPALLLEWCAAGREWHGARLFVMLRDTLAMARHGEAYLPRFHALEQMRRHHDDLVERTNLGGFAHYLDVELPPPPLPGTASIEPLDKPGAVLEEARAMEHCAATYVPDIARGRSYLYRVLAPERATLEVRMAGRGWQVTQIQGRRNTPVRPETHEAVRAWLGEVRAPPPAPVLAGDDIPF